MYKDISSCLINNGSSSISFTPTRGVRQGCPMSPYLFIICAEIFAIEVRKNEGIEGIEIGEDTHKIIQFADDTGLTLKFEQQTLQNTCKLLGNFSMHSGLSINLEKTINRRIGSIKNSNEQLIQHTNMQWTNESIKLLCAVIPNDRSRLTELNYIPKLQKMERIIAIWRPYIVKFS